MKKWIFCSWICAGVINAGAIGELYINDIFEAEFPMEAVSHTAELKPDGTVLDQYCANIKNKYVCIASVVGYDTQYIHLANTKQTKHDYIRVLSIDNGETTIFTGEYPLKDKNSGYLLHKKITLKITTFFKD